jgi:pimeloyl-ACP methyl ester carboxylesterase
MSIETNLEFIQVNGANLHYLDVGRGNPVILVHGGGATDYRTWTPVVGPFAESYRVIAPSLRYHYPNEWTGNGSDYSPETHAADIAGLIEMLGLAPAHVVGSSLGANAGLVLGREHPHLIRTLVLAEPALPTWLVETATPEEREAEARSYENSRQAVLRGNLEEAARLFSDRVIGPGSFDRLPAPARQRMIDNARLLSLPDSAWGGSSSFSREDARAITIPTLLLRGDSSPKQFLLANDELAKEMPKAERAVIPHASHLLHGMNSEAFSQVVLEFLVRH